jgi:serine phosphatase RsbU (regulator of sigma subunit)
MLRGMTVDSPDSPAELLRRLDRALQVLQIGTLASAVLARVEPEPRQGPTGVRRLCWSNAGHPPPLLRQPDGTVEVLEGEKEPLLGIDPDMPRNESAVELTEGSTLLLYTDGLIERRDVDLKDSIDALAKLFADVGDRAPQHVCDALLAAVPTDHEDDIALLVLRCGGRAGADRG